jgi:hypothetical protein
MGKGAKGDGVMGWSRHFFFLSSRSHGTHTNSFVLGIIPTYHWCWRGSADPVSSWWPCRGHPRPHHHHRRHQLARQLLDPAHPQRRQKWNPHPTPIDLLDLPENSQMSISTSSVPAWENLGVLHPKTTRSTMNKMPEVGFPCTFGSSMKCSRPS